MSRTIYPRGHYVYAYFRQNGTPYYIGKGTKRRAWTKQDRRIGVPKDRQLIAIVADDLTEIGALALERRLIRWYGRKDIGTGILINRTDGGEGSVNLSPEARKRLSQSSTGRNTKVKGKVWWNNGIENLRAFASPGNGWTRGMLGKAWNKGVKMGSHWTNGTERKITIDCPGPGWRKEGHATGQLRPRKPGSGSNHAGSTWWTNGNQRQRSIKCPGEGWSRGSGVSTTGSAGMHWWNDGIVSCLSVSSPGPGWTSGRLKLTRPPG